MATNSHSTTHDHHYPEHVRLADGERVALRPVTESDREEFRRGFERLSPESRFSRFFTPKGCLSERDLDRLTQTDDGEHHFALGVELSDGSAVGVAHFFRDGEDPELAEVAVTVVDDEQGRGLGELLFRRLVAAALDRGIQSFKAEVLGENRHMRRLVKRLAPHASGRSSMGVTSYRFALERTQTVLPWESCCGKDGLPRS